MDIVLFIILGAFGLFMTFSPESIYEIGEAWKNRNNGEPSDLYIFWIRVQGVIVLLISVAGTIGSAMLY